MQQQQNSTFIDDHAPGSLLFHFPGSPIITPKNRHRRQNQRNANNKEPSANHLSDAKATAPKVDIDAPLLTGHTQNKHDNTTNENDQPTKATNRRHLYRHRQRFESLCNANSTMKQSNEELPIWLSCNELRYVSGVTKTTTCYEIIKALIDDELCNGNDNGNAQFYNTENNINNNIANNKLGPKKKKYGDHGSNSGAELRDYNDFVITERLRGIERSYDSAMAILPVWLAGSRVHNELCLSLKLRQVLRESESESKLKSMPLQSIKFSSPWNGFSILKCLKRLLNFSCETKKKSYIKNLNTITQTDNKSNFQPKTETIEIKVILPDQHYEKPSTNKSTERCLKKNHHKTNKNTTETFINNNIIRRRRKDPSMRNNLRNKLASLNVELNARYEKEYHLTRELTHKCKHYQNQSERFTNRDRILFVGKLQGNIKDNVQDIAKAKQELLELKNDIKQNLCLINSLKQITLEKDSKIVEKVVFVDNINEFCDNNDSMLV